MVAGHIRRVWSYAALGAAMSAALFFAACGERKEAAKPPAPAAAVSGGPALWTLSDADSKIYLFGTFHLLPNDLVWRDQRIDQAFLESSLLMLEADIEGTPQDQLIKLVQEHGIAPEGRRLRARMRTPEEVAAYESLVTSLGLKAEIIDAFEPWYASTVLTVEFANRQGYSAEAGVETTLAREARAGGKSLAFFETLEQQILFFSGFPEEVQLKMLAATVEELKSEPELLAQMQEAWKKGDTARMASLFDASIRKVPELRSVLIVERNQRWANELASMLNGTGNAFVAVGAGHLVGDDSVIAMLREKGLKVDGP